MKYATLVYFFAGILVMSVLGAREDHSESTDLLIDPHLIAEAAEVWSILTASQNRVWPGWDVSDTPILFYLPGQQDLLINHPNPPEGFIPYKGPLSFPGATMFVRNGATFFDLDGQNTSTRVNGLSTLVVADTLSNLRQQLMTILNDPRPVREKFPPGNYDVLATNPYGQMTMIAHEAFHVFQEKKAPQKGGDESALLGYPVLSVTNNVGFALEGDILAEAIRAETVGGCRAAAVRWFAVRMDRRYQLPQDSIAYEDGIEFSEGLARYVEYKLAAAMETRQPGDALKWIRGFRGRKGYSAYREGIIDMMANHMRGAVNVNNDPYGTAPLRMRLYFSGLAIAAVLDRLSPGWHDRIFEKETTLTGLAQKAIEASFEELEQALAEVQDSPSYESLVAEKERLEQDGEAHVEALLESIVHGKNTLLTIEYGALDTARMGLRYTPFGLTVVDEDRVIYRIVPFGAMFSRRYEFTQTEATPALHDRKNERFEFQLLDTVSLEDLTSALNVDELPEEPLRNCEFDLPGVHLKAGKAAITWTGERITVTFLPGRR